MAKHKMTSSCACILILVSQAFSQMITHHGGYPTTVISAPGLSTPVHHITHHSQLNFPMMHMYDHGELIDQRLDYMKDLAKHRMAMNALRQPIPSMGLYSGYPSSMVHHPHSFHRPQNTQLISNQPMNSPNQQIQSTSPGANNKKVLKRKKRFVPMPFGPLGPLGAFGGFSPMMNMIRGAFAGRMVGMRAMTARRNRMNTMRRRDRSNFNQQQSAATTTVQLSVQPSMDNSFNAIDRAINQQAAMDPVVAKSIASNPSITQQLSAQPIANAQPIMTQNVIATIDQPLMTQNTALQQPTTGFATVEQPSAVSAHNVIVDPLVSGGQMLAQSTVGSQLSGQPVLDQQVLQQSVITQQNLGQQIDTGSVQQPLDLGVQGAVSQQILAQQPATNTLDSIGTQQFLTDLSQSMNSQQTGQQTTDQILISQQPSVSGLDVLGGQQALTQPQGAQQYFADFGQQQALNQQASNQQIIVQPTNTFDIIGTPSTQQLYSGLGQTVDIQQALNPQAASTSQLISQPQLDQAFNQQLTLNNAQQLDLQNVINQQLAAQAANQLAGGLQQPTSQQNQQIVLQQQPTANGMVFPDLFNFNDPTQGNTAQQTQGNAVQQQANAVPSITLGNQPAAATTNLGPGAVDIPNMTANYGGGSSQPIASETGQQANLSTLDLIANLASLNQRGVLGGGGGGVDALTV